MNKNLTFSWQTYLEEPCTTQFQNYQNIPLTICDNKPKTGLSDCEASVLFPAFVPVTDSVQWLSVAGGQQV